MLTKPGEGGRITFKTIKHTASGRPKFNSSQTARSQWTHSIQFTSNSTCSSAKRYLRYLFKECFELRPPRSCYTPVIDFIHLRTFLLPWVSADQKKAKAASFPGASSNFRDSIVLAVMRIRWRWNSPIGTVSLGEGKSWHWLQVGLSDSHQNYHPEKRKIYQTRNHDQLHVFLIKKYYPDAKAAYRKFCLNPTSSPLPPPPLPWTDNNHAANQMRNMSKFGQCKRYWISCPFEFPRKEKVQIYY